MNKNFIVPGQEQVHLQVSWDGGFDWMTLREYQWPFYAKPQLDTVAIPEPEAGTVFFKVRLMQSESQSRRRNVWAVAAFGVSTSGTVYDQSRLDSTVLMSWEADPELWIVRNVADPRQHCAADEPQCRTKPEWYGALTQPLKLQAGDVVQFHIRATTAPSLASTKWSDGITFDYSADGGSTWHLVQTTCRRTWLNCEQVQQASLIDYRGLRTDTDYHFAYFPDENTVNR